MLRRQMKPELSQFRPLAHMLEGENRLPQVVLWTPRVCQRLSFRVVLSVRETDRNQRVQMTLREDHHWLKQSFVDLVVSRSIPASSYSMAKEAEAGSKAKGQSWFGKHGSHHSGSSLSLQWAAISWGTVSLWRCESPVTFIGQLAQEEQSSMMEIRGFNNGGCCWCLVSGGQRCY